MITLRASACIEAPAQDVWVRLASLEDIQLWSDAVVSAHCQGSRSRGVGAERTCTLVGGRTIREHWLAWDERRSFQYEGRGIPLVKRARNRWSVLPQGAQSLLTSEAEVELRGGAFGRMLEPLMGVLMRRMAPSALAGFKYLVENGQPHGGRASQLPRAAAT